MTDRTPTISAEPPGSDAGSALDRLLDADRPEPGPDFDARFFERLGAARAEDQLDALLDPTLGGPIEPGAGFDARFFERLAAEDAEGRLSALLDPVVGADRPTPGPDFDAGVLDQLGPPDASDALDLLLDPMAGADRAGPGVGFDHRVPSGLRSGRAEATRAGGGARILRFVRRPVVLVPLAAAAALLMWLATRAPAVDPPQAELALLSHLELLQVYDEMEVLDGIADDETFELVAMLHTLDSDEEARQ